MGARTEGKTGVDRLLVLLVLGGLMILVLGNNVSMRVTLTDGRPAVADQQWQTSITTRRASDLPIKSNTTQQKQDM